MPLGVNYIEFMRMLAFLVLLSAFTVSAAGVYRWVAPDGSIEYSDAPRPGAVEIDLPKFPPPKERQYPPPSNTSEKTKKPEVFEYHRLVITKPQSGQTARDNQGNVEVNLTVDPEFNTEEGHKIQILLDGRAHGNPSPTLTQLLKGIDRGTHTVAAQVIDKAGQILIKSQPVTIFLKHMSRFHPRGPIPAPNVFTPGGQPSH